MEFLDGNGATARIRALTGASKAVRMAIAFWGNGAAAELGLDAKGSAATVICNLKCGGTNPAEIHKLIEAGVTVRQSDVLHGKVYLFDSHALVGSSNASANGLGYQDRECSGWLEANVLIDSQASAAEAGVHARLVDWFSKVEARPIIDKDLAAAFDLWSRRRGLSVQQKPNADNLLDALIAKPSEFEGRPLYLLAYQYDISKETSSKVEELCRDKKLVGEWDAFEDWHDLPEAADLICFQVNEDKVNNGKVRFDGFWHAPSPRVEEKTKSHKIQLTKKLPEFSGFSRKQIGNIDKWAEALRELAGREFGRDKAAQIELSEFARRFLLGAADTVNNTRQIEREFQKRLEATAAIAARECNYPPHQFVRMLKQHGGVRTAQMLLHKPGVSDGFVKLWMAGRKDLTVEHIVLEPRWHALFTDAERAIASRRIQSGPSK